MDKRTKVFLGRRLGASPEARERMAVADAEATWHAWCPNCNMKLKGALKDLREHRCETSQ